LGWLIDPDERAVLVYPPGQQPQFLQKEQEILPVPHLVGDFQLSIGQLFGWLKL
jgi:Uma2 family endonuclease